MAKNEDYIKGMKFLLAKCKEEKIEIRNIWWIPKLCSLLSKMNKCYDFWYNVYIQNNLGRIKLARCPHDLFHVHGKSLFIWSVTKEGHGYWEDVKINMFPTMEIEDTKFENLW